MTNLSLIEDRPFRASHQDGLAELAFGFFLVALSAGLLIAQMSSASPFPFLWIFLPAVLTAGLCRWAMPRLKASMTVPRIGHVELRPPSSGRKTAAILSTVAFGVLTAFALFVLGSSAVGRIVVLISPVLAAVLVHGAIRWSMPRYFALAAVPCMFGVWAYYSTAGLSALPRLFLSLALAFGAAGGIRLFRFLETYPVQTERLS